LCNAARTDNGITALMCASQKGHLGIAQLLVEEGANVNAKTKTDLTRWFGFTALHIAKQSGKKEIVRYLENIPSTVTANPLAAAGAGGGGGGGGVVEVQNPLEAARAVGATVEVSNPFYHEGKQRKSRKASKGRKSRKSRKGRKGRKTKRN
jgi:hypothetical protein